MSEIDSQNMSLILGITSGLLLSIFDAQVHLAFR
jgi:hypothetical protein